MRFGPLLATGLLFVLAGATAPPATAEEQPEPDLDTKVSAFLEARKRSWHDLNIPASDGQTLFDLIVKNGYTRAVEVGTSTGHSAIWIAWGLSKTGGKLITIEIDEGRHTEALKNFKEAGVSELIDARLANAHELVPELEGPIDFVFLDADKGWYVKYFRYLLPKLADGACIAAHNVTGRWTAWQKEYLDALDATPGMKTQYIGPSGHRGFAVSFYTEVD
jgi:predicted O-methyltransferase YrrM